MALVNSVDENEDVKAQESDEEILTQETADSVFNNAKKLFDQKDYSAAAGEVSRVLSFL